MRYLTLIIAAILIGCGPDSKKDYEDTKKLLDATEQTIDKTIDFDAKMKACDDAIRILQNFLNSHKEGEWVNVAKTSLESWRTRKSGIQNELESLRAELLRNTEKIARRAALKLHALSDIENVFHDGRTENKEGNNILVTDTYNIRMKGSLIGTSIFKLKIVVTGRIAMDTKTVFADEDNTKIFE